MKNDHFFALYIKYYMLTVYLNLDVLTIFIEELLT